MPSATTPDPGTCPVTCPLQNCSGVPRTGTMIGPINAARALDTCCNRRQTRARVPDNPCCRPRARLAIRPGQRDARRASNVLALRLRDRSTGEYRTAWGRWSADVAGLSRSAWYRLLPGHPARRDRASVNLGRAVDTPDIPQRVADLANCCQRPQRIAQRVQHVRVTRSCAPDFIEAPANLR